MSKKPEKFPGVKMSYKELGSSLFHQTLNMLYRGENQDSIDLAALGRIRLLFKAVMKQLDIMQAKYLSEIQKPFYALLKEAGIEWEEGQDPPELGEAKTAEFKKLQAANEEKIKEFEKIEVYVDCIPLAPQHLAKVKGMSAARLDSLAGLYDEDGAVRSQAFKGRVSR